MNSTLTARRPCRDDDGSPAPRRFLRLHLEGYRGGSLTERNREPPFEPEDPSGEERSLGLCESPMLDLGVTSGMDAIAYRGLRLDSVGFLCGK
ncbi:hypothetical protein KM043_010653 [Ampulex compressa]|nr:hypothetical protein KM043_010653 [Ampulex compressa]